MSHFFSPKRFYLLGFIALLFIGCGKPNPKDFVIDKEFQKHINSFTSGVISVASPITIQLVEPYKGEITLNEPVTENLFKISPSLKGKTVWLNPHTVQFIPEERLISGQDYWVDFDLGKIANVPQKLKTFTFPFSTIKQGIRFESNGLLAYSDEFADWYQFSGTAITADVIEESVLSDNIEITVNGKKQSSKFERQGNRNIYNVIVDSIPRLEKEGEIIIKWNNLSKGKDSKKETKLKIPSLNEFEIINVEVIQQPEQHVLVRFSDPLSTNQNRDGLVDINGTNFVRTLISTNELRIYPSEQLIGNYTLFISEAIQNAKGYQLPKDERFHLEFEAINPEVRLVGKGTILPSSNNMILPFEAVNLRAVDIRIIKIFENNILQFFQGNNFDGEEGLKRVGRLIRKKTIYLDKGNPLNLSRWNRFNLDLSEYIKVEPGAIYRVEIGFRKYQSVYPCSENDTESDVFVDENDWDETDYNTKEDWNYYSDWNSDYYDYNWFDGYNYQKREDPCSHSYYRNRSKAKNIFASDIGLITKRGTNGETLIIATDLIKARPLQGAGIKIYDYQQQLITKGITDKDGVFKTPASKTVPFFVVAENKGQKGYLKLGDGNSLSMSHFKIDGTATQEGLKGYLYGERGVWRPGDTLFLNFILEDKERTLPKNHPVIFELFNARGQLVKREIETNSLNGFYNFTTPTTADAPTGNWLAKVEVGGASFTKTLKVETIKPNRLKINLDIKDKLISGNNPIISGSLTANWLHGAPGKRLKTDVSVRFAPTKSIFKDFDNYIFDDPSKSFYSEEEVLLEGKLNDEGKLNFRERAEIYDQAPGMLKAIFTTRVYENGGGFSIDQKAVNYAPYDYFVGIKSPEKNNYGALETDSTYRLPIITLDKNGKRAKNREIEVAIYRIDWSWWWESDDEYIANYINRNSTSLLSRETLTTNEKGEAIANIRIDKYDWGRYFIQINDNHGNHSTGLMTYFDWPSWMSRSGRENPSGATALTFSPDKEEYQTGEKANISFQSAENSRALISIENGSKVLKTFWLKAEKGETSFSLPITPDLAPNCYVYITLLQPHSQTENDAPIRMYGVTSLSVKDPKTVLEPEIKMPEELAPNSTFTIEVKEKNKQDMTYTIAVVDEGLLDLTRFKTPNPWSYFYAREALGVKTWDLYDYVIGAYGAKIENVLTIGGDENIEPGEESPIRFKPMVRFIGPFSLKGGKTAQHKLSVPNYIGSVRTMVVAGQNGAYGNVEKTTPVKKPLMILSTLPRVLGPQEKVKLPVNVFAMDKKVKNVKIQVKVNDKLIILGDSQKNITFQKEGDQLVNFDLEVGTISGAAKVEIIATSGNERATETIELEVRQPNLKSSQFVAQTIEGGNNWTTSIALHGMENSNSAVLELSAIPAINLEKRLGYLLQYPHGCIEQKTSAAFPQLYLSSLIEIDAKTKTRIDNNVRSVLNKIQRHQLTDGGLSFWEGNRMADDWGTTYAGHFMLEAEKKGYSLPYGVKEKWLHYQKEQARNWTAFDRNGYRSNDLSQAYRLYTLALAGEPALGAMNKLRTQSNLSIQGAWRLAAAYQIIGKTEVAKEIIHNKSTQVRSYTEWSSTYGNDTRDKAMIIEALTLMGEKTKAAVLVRELAEELSKDYWMSTQTTAYSLLSIALFTENNKPKEGISANYIYQGKTTPISSNRAIELIDLPVQKEQKNVEIQVQNKNNTILFARVISTGIPLPGNELETSNDLKLEVIYRDLSGQKINANQIEQGTDFIAEVTVINPGYRGDYKGLSLSQIFPSGWEIKNHRMDLESSYNNQNQLEYQDIRDDRVYSYFNLDRNQSTVIRTQLHAAYIGEYYLPAVYIEAMYDATISALKKGQKTQVVKIGSN